MYPAIEAIPVAIGARHEASDISALGPTLDDAIEVARLFLTRAARQARARCCSTHYTPLWHSQPVLTLAGRSSLHAR